MGLEFVIRLPRSAWPTDTQLGTVWCRVWVWILYNVTSHCLHGMACTAARPARHGQDGTACMARPAKHAQHGTATTVRTARHGTHGTSSTARPARHGLHGTACTARPARHGLHGTASTARPARHGHHGTVSTAQAARRGQHGSASTSRPYGHGDGKRAGSGAASSSGAPPRLMLWRKRASKIPYDLAELVCACFATHPNNQANT